MFITAALVVSLSAVSADEEDQTTTVGVEVDDLTQLDVRPSALNYTDVEPGSQSTDSDEGFEHLDIENAGSERIETIHAETEMPVQQPFGTTEEDVYNTGNFIQLGVETAVDQVTNARLPDAPQYQDENGETVNDNDYDEVPQEYVNRVEFFEDNPPEYIVLEDEAEWNVGRFREGDVEYFFVANDNALDGDSADGIVRIGQIPHTPTELGTFDFSDDADNYVEFNADPDDEFVSVDGASGMLTVDEEPIQLATFDTSDSDVGDTAVLDEDADVDLSDFGSDDLSDVEVREYDVIFGDGSEDGTTETDEDYVLRTSLNVMPAAPESIDDGSERTDFDPNLESQFIFEGSADDDRLQPGQNFPVDISVELPQGVDQEEVESGAVTFYASTDSEAPDPLSD